MTKVENADRIRFVLMREHPLLGYALFFMLGAYLALIINISMGLCIAALIVLVGCTAAFAIKQKKSWYFIIFIFTITGYVLCSSSIPKWYSEDYVPPEKCQIIGTVENVKNTSYSSEYILRDVTINTKQIESKIIVKNITKNNYVDTGERIKLTAELERPAVMQKDGMFSEARYYMTKNIQYTCTIFDSRIDVIGKDDSAAALNSKWQEKIYTQLNKDFSQPVLGMIYSISTGNKSYMDTEIYNMCADLGIAHIFAVSGLHIGALLIMWEYYCKKRKKRFLIRILGSTVLVFLLYITVGSRASLLRAIVMWMLVVIYQYAGIKGDLTDFLAIAMLVLLIINPLYVIDVGFLLSVSCVAAIGLVYVPIVNRYKGSKIINFYPVSMFIVSASILSMSWIITAKVFGNISLMSPVWNVVFVPMIIVLLALVLCYALIFYVPILSTAIVWIIDNLAKIIIKLVRLFSSINLKINMPSISFGVAVAVVIIFLLMTDAVLKGRKRIRLAVGITGIAAIISIVFLCPVQPRMEVFAGYDAAFVYIYEDSKSVLILNENDGGIQRVLEDIDVDEVDMFFYSGNDIWDLEKLLASCEDIIFDEIIVHKDLLSNYDGEYAYSCVDSNECIDIGNVTIKYLPFKANKNAIVHYYADITYYDNQFLYLDPYRLREGTIKKSETVISSAWTKQRVENVIYTYCKYVIINSNDYLMDDTPVIDNKSIDTYNINNSGAITYYPQGEK